MLRKIIINADDYGINPKVTKSIEEFILEGKISSTTIMANGSCLEQALKFSKKHPEISFGIHLCLDEFDSLSKSPVLKKYGLIDSDGCFIKGAIFNISTYPLELLNAIKYELSMQFDKLIDLGFDISHVDSHHHVHTIYGLQNTFIEVLKKYKVKKIRLGESPFVVLFNRRKMKEVNSPSENKSKGVIYKHVKIYKFCMFVFTRLLLNMNYKWHFQTTSLFSSYTKYSLFYKKWFFSKTIELMCHPGHNGDDYVNEMSLIADNELNKKICFKIITYKQL